MAGAGEEPQGDRPEVFDLDERDGRPGFVRSRAGMSFVNIAKVRAALRRASRLKVHVSSIVMDFLVYSRGAPVAGDSEDDPELDEQHWSYMDGFADGMTARGPTFGTDRQTWTGSLAFTWSICPARRPCVSSWPASHTTKQGCSRSTSSGASPTFSGGRCGSSRAPRTSLAFSSSRRRPRADRRVRDRCRSPT